MPESADRPSFLIACCSIAFRDRPVSEAVEEIAAAGFAGIEILHPHIAGMDDAALGELAAQCAALDLRVPVISPYFSFTRGPEKILDSLKTAEEVLHAAAILGTKKIRTFIDIGGDGLPSAEAGEDQWKSTCAGLRELCSLDPATEFVVETHKNTLADSLPSVRRLLDQVGKPNLRLNFQSNPDFLDRGFTRCLDELYPAISHLHWQQVRADRSETYIEEPGLIDFGGLIRDLGARNYAGTASVEYCWAELEEGRVASAGRFLAEITA